MCILRTMVEAIVSTVVSCQLAQVHMHTYLLQLAQGNGKKSSFPQYSNWQCLPMFSTSPFDILCTRSGICGRFGSFYSFGSQLYAIQIILRGR